MGSGLCGLKAYDDIITDGKKQSAQEIQETLLKKKNFNEGKKHSLPDFEMLCLLLSEFL